MAKRIYKLVHGVKQSNDKTFWTQHGILVVDDSEKPAKLSVKLGSVPVGEWNGWFNVFPIEKKPEPKPETTTQDDIPF